MTLYDDIYARGMEYKDRDAFYDVLSILPVAQQVIGLCGVGAGTVNLVHDLACYQFSKMHDHEEGYKERIKQDWDYLSLSFCRIMPFVGTKISFERSFSVPVPH